MSYTIRFNIKHVGGDKFRKVEKCVFHYAQGGTWVKQDGQPTLVMGASGTSGLLRFASVSGDEMFAVVAGIHNWTPWVDIAADLSETDTGVKVLPEYYAAGPRSDASGASASVTTRWNRDISATYSAANGNDLTLDITIE